MTDNHEIVPADNTTDHKGRVFPEYMGDREIAVEILHHLRAVADTIEDLSASPMFAALQSGGNPFMAMFGR